MENLVLRYNRLLSVIVDSGMGLSDVTVLDLRYCLSVIKSDIDSLGYSLVYDDAGFIVDYSIDDSDVNLGDCSFSLRDINWLLNRFNYVNIKGIPGSWNILKGIDRSRLSSDDLVLLDEGYVPFDLVYKFRRRNSLHKKHSVPLFVRDDVKLKRVRCNVEYIPVDIDQFIKSSE